MNNFLENEKDAFEQQGQQKIADTYAAKVTKFPGGPWTPSPNIRYNPEQTSESINQ